MDTQETTEDMRAEWQPVLDQIVSKLENDLHEIYNIWRQMGFKQEERAFYGDQFHEHHVALSGNMRTEAWGKHMKLCMSIKDMLEEYCNLGLELHVEVDTNIYTEMPLIDVEKQLKVHIAALKDVKEERLRCFKKLRSMESELCEAMGLQPLVVESELPTEEELSSFKTYLNNQLEEKKRRQNKLEEHRETVLELFKELGLKPDSEFEKVVCQAPSSLQLSSGNMMQVEELVRNLIVQVDTKKSELKGKIEDLQKLWSYLKLPDRTDDLLSRYPNDLHRTILIVDEEIKVCKALRMENIALFVNKIRAEIEELWDACRMSDDERRQFRAFYSTIFNEDLLTLHELEVKSLQRRLNANREIFELLEECDQLKEKMKELEERSKDPNRFNNRRGQLLKEEKERKIIQKKLPQMEEHLRNFATAYEENYGKPFTVYGINMDEYLQQFWNDRAQEKLCAKNARLQAKSAEKSMKKTTPCSMSRLAGVSKLQTFSSVPKRKLKYEVSPNMRTPQPKKRRSRVLGSKIRLDGMLPGRGSRRNSSISKGNHSRRKSNSNSSQSSCPPSPSMASYNQFQAHLSAKSELRSSVLPEHVLKNALKGKENEGPRTLNVMRTPIKPLRRATPKKVVNAPRINTPRVNTPRAVTPASSRTLRATPLSRSPRAKSPHFSAAPKDLPIIF